VSRAGSSQSPRLRVVHADEAPPRRRRPGPAALAVLLYAILFALALWFLRGRLPPAHARMGPAPGGSARPAAPRRSGSPTRAWLLSGAGLAGASRDELARRLAAGRCDCGCELTLRECLARDRSCSRSPELASDLAEALR
jgi:hypothetical protein